MLEGKACKEVRVIISIRCVDLDKVEHLVEILSNVDTHAVRPSVDATVPIFSGGERNFVVSSLFSLL